MSGNGGSRQIRAVTRQELTDAFNSLGLWNRIYDRRLIEHIAAERPTLDPAGGWSQIVKHHDGGSHVATTHRVVDARGRVLHWDEKDCILPNGTKLVRRG